MAVSSSPKTSSKHDRDLLAAIASLAPNATFVAGTTFVWSPKNRHIYYVKDAITDQQGQWSLLHEACHAILEHNNYKNDFELLQFEVAAWEKAVELSAKLNVSIDKNFVQDCLDTYRDWLHQRSTCPTCGSGGLQHDPKTYHCHNCLSQWHVTQSRFCRPYRTKKT